MSTRTKKLVITFSIIGALVVLMIVFGALFSLKTINVDFRTTGSHVSAYSNEQIIKDSGIKKGKNIIFTNFKAAEAKLEKAIPYGKFKIVRTFPNRVTIRVSEREKAFRVADDEGLWHIYDEDLKCLEVVPNVNLNLGSNDLVPILHGSDIKNVDEGEFADNKNLSSKITAIIDGVYGAGQTPLNIMSDITLSYDQSNQFPVCTLTVRATEVKIVIQGESNFVDKLAYAVYVYNDVAQDATGAHVGHLNQVEIRALSNYEPSHRKVNVICPLHGNEEVDKDFEGEN